MTVGLVGVKMPTMEENMNLMVSLMGEQLKWVKLTAMGQLRTIFDKSFSSNDERAVYELSNGERSVRDIEKLSNIGRTKIASLWKKWHNMGIMEESEKYGGRRMKRSFSLSDVGIQVSMPGEDEKSMEGFE